MKIISCNYAGPIPSLGRGPIVNRPVTDAVYNQLRAMGFPITISVSKATPNVKVTRVMHVPTIEENRSKNKDPQPAEVIMPKKDVPKKEAPKVKETPKVVEVEVKAPAAVEEAVIAPEQSYVEVVSEQPVLDIPTADAEQPETSEKPAVYTKEELEAMSKEELDALLPADIARPVRYGKPWLIKTYLANVANA